MLLSASFTPIIAYSLANVHYNMFFCPVFAFSGAPDTVTALFRLSAQSVSAFLALPQSGKHLVQAAVVPFPALPEAGGP